MKVYSGLVSHFFYYRVNCIHFFLLKKMEDPIVRAVTIAAKVAEVNPSQEYLLTFEKFNAIMEKNRARLNARPEKGTTAVQWNYTAVAEMEAAVHKASFVLGKYNFTIHNLGISTLFKAFKACITYVGFMQLLGNLRAIMKRVVNIHLENRKTNPKELIVLGIRNMNIQKSNMWLALHCWFNVPEMRKCIDCVAGDSEIADRLKVKLGPDWKVYHLFIDDMSYSGGQLVHYCNAIHRNNHVLQPIIPFITSQVRQMFDNVPDDTIDWFTSSPFVIQTPQEILLTYDKYTREDSGIKIPRIDRIFKPDEQSLEDSMFYTRDMIDSIMKNLVTNRKDTTFALPWQTNVELESALLLYWRLMGIHKPVIVFEHKFADSVSISTRFFYLPLAPELQHLNLAPTPLIHVSKQSLNQLEKGSIPFYREILTAQPYCWSCGLTMAALNVCPTCDTATYCNVDCQKIHWTAIHHKQCKLPLIQAPLTIGVDYTEADLKQADFYTHFFNGREQILGRGGRGVVFINPDFHGIVIKKANNSDTCRGNNEEYDTICTIQYSLKDLDFGLFSIIKTHNYTVNDFMQCFLIMDHIRKPAIPKQFHWKPVVESLQTYFGYTTHHEVHPSRGEYIGRNEIQRFLFKHSNRGTSEEMIQLCSDLGKFIASIHLVAKYDGVDIEYILGYGREDGGTKLQVVALDFDLCKKIPDWSPGYEGGIEKCTWSLTSEQYYPHYDPEDPENPCYIAFKTAYRAVAESCRMQMVAEDILKKYEEYYV